MKSSSIGKKIWFSISILILGYFISMLTGNILGSSTESALTDISESVFPASSLSQEALSALNDEIRSYDDAVMFGDEEKLAAALENVETLEASLQAILELTGLSEEMKAESRSLAQDIANFNSACGPVYAELSIGNESDALIEKTSDLARDTEALRARLVDLKDDFAQELQSDLVNIGKNTRRQRHLNAAIFLAVVAVTLVLTWIMINRYVIKPVTLIIDDLNGSSDQLTEASDQIAASGKTLADATSEQAASLEETTAALGEVASMTRKNEDNAAQADHLTHDAAEIVAKAKSSMEALSNSMQEISTASQDTSKIIKTIDEIAFQTNLLALNAAVEAARAGEAGAGFAVVADEVRNLAMRAGEAATSTTALIEDTIAKVNTGSDLVKKTQDAVTKAEESSNRVSGLISEISEASKGQARSFEQINAAVSEIDRGTQNSAANAEESASASTAMNLQTAKMRRRINELQVVIFGGKDATQKQVWKNNHDKKAPPHITPQRPSSHLLTAKGTREVLPEEIIPMDSDRFMDF